MKFRTLLKCILFGIVLTADAQIRTDYSSGTNIPDNIDLKLIAPKGIIKLELKKPYPDGFYTLIVEKDNYRNETDFIRLMNFEVIELLSKVWGKGTLTQKKALLKEFLFSLGCTQNNYGYIMFYGSRWHDAICYEIDDNHYKYPYCFDGIISIDDTKDKYFGRPVGHENVITDLLPRNSGITHLELSYNLLQQGNHGIIIQTTRNYTNEYYYREISREEKDEIDYTIAGNYPRKIKEDYICSKLVAYGANTVSESSSKWNLLRINKIDGELDLYHAVRIGNNMSTTQRNMTKTNSNVSVRSVLFDFIRSKVFTKQELEWYNRHFTKEQLDVMTGFGLNIAIGGNGNVDYRCGACSATFSSSADLRSHQNAYHDY